MTSIASLQNNPALAQLLSIQQAAQVTTPVPAQAGSSQSGDTLSISSAALQALQGQPQDLAQIQQAAQAYPTYQAHRHHHHHHHGGAAQPAASQSGQAASPSAQAAGSGSVAPIGQAETSQG